MCLRIIKEGLFTSLQGTGTYGLQRFGINPRGAMDRRAVRILNALLQNRDANLALELHFPAGEIEFDDPYVFAIGGADFDAELSRRPLERWRAYEAAPGDVLRFPGKIAGARCYLAVRGGLAEKLGSEDRTAFERFTTRRLRKGDTIHLDLPPPARFTIPPGKVSPTLIPDYRPDPAVRFIAGAEYNLITEQGRELIRRSEFAVTPDSNRMGFRLNGPELELTGDTEMISAAVTFGTIQRLPNGQLIVLMADHQTSGGYPRIGNVISADLPLLGQLMPGNTIRFRAVQIEEAEFAAVRFEQELRMLRTGVSFGRYW